MTSSLSSILPPAVSAVEDGERRERLKRVNVEDGERRERMKRVNVEDGERRGMVGRERVGRTGEEVLSDGGGRRRGGEKGREEERTLGMKDEGERWKDKEGFN